MNEETLNRIANALERIATMMENKEKREINEARKAIKIEREKVIKSTPRK